MKPRDNSKDRADGTVPEVPPREESRSAAGSSHVVRSRPSEEAAWFGTREHPSRAPEPAPAGLTLRGSFVRVVGPPAVPPSRRSPPSGEAWEPAFKAPVPDHSAADRSTPSAESDQHEAFALDRPLSSAGDRPASASTTESGVVSRGSLPEVVQRSRIGSVILPPPPGAGDFQPASGPDSAPPPAPVPSAPLRALASPAAPSPVASRSVVKGPQAVDELPSVNPFAGFEAPRESWGRRSVIVFTLALALVGLCGLVAIAFGFLGKRGW